MTSTGLLESLCRWIALPLWYQQAAVYGKCVASTTTGRQELKKDLCAKEFDALKTCFTTAVRCACPTFTLAFWKWSQSMWPFFYCRPRKKSNKSTTPVGFSHMVLAGPVIWQMKRSTIAWLNKICIFLCFWQYTLFWIVCQLLMFFYVKSDSSTV